MCIRDSYLRPAHLAQLRKILDDPEATENDRFVARTMLQNACVSAGMVLPSCQDTGTAIVIGKKGQRVWTNGADEEAIAAGVYRTYTETNLRFALAVEPQSTPLRERVERVARIRAAGLPSIPSTLREEKQTNPFLRCGEPAVMAAARAHGAVDASPEAVFAAIRGWRNNF